MLQRAAGPRGLSGAVYGDPTVRRPNGSIAKGSLRPNVYLAVTASSVQESAFTVLHAGFQSVWTRYAVL
jgi:hypothetical protein